jgi:hypothetical protein
MALKILRTLRAQLLLFAPQIKFHSAAYEVEARGLSRGS